jgi:predicted DNA-binding WGR domain protein
MRKNTKHQPSAHRHFINQENGSNKFWTIDLKGKKYEVVFGKMGSKGTSILKEFDSKEDCITEAEKLIREKLNKGYKEVADKSETFLYGRETFKATKKVMPEVKFWKIIAASFDKAKGNYTKQKEALKSELKTLNPQDIICFSNTFHDLIGGLYNQQVWAAADIIRGGCGDDSFYDFRDWLIAQGKIVYNKTKRNPETLVSFDSKKMAIEWGGMYDVSERAFYELTGREIPVAPFKGIGKPVKLSGYDWEQGTDDQKNMFPELWAKYEKKNELAIHFARQQHLKLKKKTGKN